MNLSKKLIALLAIFCMIASAGTVCAADNDANGGLNYMSESGYAGSDLPDDISGWAGANYEESMGGYAGSNYQDDGGWAGANYQDDGGWAGSQYNETAENAAAANQTAQNATANQTVQNATANQTAPNATAVHAVTTEDANTNPGHNMLSTGNPILLLIGACSLLGGAVALRKRN